MMMLMMMMMMMMIMMMMIIMMMMNAVLLQALSYAHMKIFKTRVVSIFTSFTDISLFIHKISPFLAILS